MRIGFIGCGQICDYHAVAMKAAGFEITAVCSRPGSRTPYAFAARHGIPRVFDGPEALLEAQNLWDTLLIATPPEATPSILRRAIALGVPILVEKPAAKAAADLKPFVGKELPVLVGYNRRFYPPLRKLREIVAETGEAFLGHLVISETVDTGDLQAFCRRMTSNSVHALDLLRFLFGPLRVEAVHPVRGAGGKCVGIAALLCAADSGSWISLSATWNAPANLSLTLVKPDLRAVLEPLELLKLYRTMQRIEPTPEMPLRRYVPRQSAKVSLSQVDLAYKPGFYRQAEALRSLAVGGKPQGAATVEDAYHALALAEELISPLKSSAAALP